MSNPTDARTTLRVPEHLRGFSRSELVRRALIVRDFARLEERDIAARNQMEAAAREMEEASKHAS